MATTSLNPSHDVSPTSCTKSSINVSERERNISMIVGGMLLFYGLGNFRTYKGKMASLTSLSLLSRGMTGHCSIYQILDVDTSPAGKEKKKGPMDIHPYTVTESITIMRQPEECYLFCLDLLNARRCIPHVHSIEATSETHSCWVFTDDKGVVHIPVEVDIQEDTSTKSLAWQAAFTSKLNLTGTIQFRNGPKPEETEVIVQILVNPPVGVLGSTIMKAVGPFSSSLISNTLHRYKQLIETGEIVSNDGGPTGEATKMNLKGLGRYLVNKAFVKAYHAFGERRSS